MASFVRPYPSEAGNYLPVTHVTDTRRHGTAASHMRKLTPQVRGMSLSLTPVSLCLSTRNLSSTSVKSGGAKHVHSGSEFTEVKFTVKLDSRCDGSESVTSPDFGANDRVSGTAMSSDGRGILLAFGGHFGEFCQRLRRKRRNATLLPSLSGPLSESVREDCCV